MQINTKEDFDNLFDRIKKLVDRYDNNSYHFNQYKIFLANGEKLFFEIAPSSIPHLLGINIDYLRSTNFFKSQNAYDILKEFLENSYSIYTKVKEGHLSLNSIFSDYIDYKLKSFEQIIYYFNPSDIEFICKYDKSKTYQLGLDNNLLCDYFIVKKDTEKNLCILGLKQRTDGYAPMTNIFIPTGESQLTALKDACSNQTLTFANSIIIENPITNFQSKSYLPLALKSEKAKSLGKFKKVFPGSSVDVSSDYQFTINGCLMKESKLNLYKTIFQQLTNAILERDVFSLEQMEDFIDVQDDDLSQMINAYNDEISKVSSSKAQETYSELLEQCQTLGKKVVSLSKQLEESEQKALEYYQTVQSLEKENKEYQEFQDNIVRVVNQKIRN